MHAEGKTGGFWEAVSSVDSTKVTIKYPKMQDKAQAEGDQCPDKISQSNIIKLIGMSRAIFTLSKWFNGRQLNLFYWSCKTTNIWYIGHIGAVTKSVYSDSG